MMDDKALEKKFEKKLKLRAALSVMIIAAGVLSLALSVYAEAKGFISSEGNMTGYYVGMGGGLMGAGIVTLIKSIVLLKHAEKQRKQRMVEYDERNLYLRSCTMTYSGYIIIGVLYMGVIIFGFYYETAAMILLSIMCLYLVVIFIVNILLRKLF